MDEDLLGDPHATVAGQDDGTRSRGAAAAVAHYGDAGRVDP
jgi:hypothetical protein